MASRYKHEFLAGECYHIYNQCVSHVNYFEQTNNSQHFLDKFQEYFINCFNIYAYCLMPNHFHMIVNVKKEDEVLESLKNKSDSKAIESFKKGEIPLDEYILDQLKRFISSITMSYKRNNDHRGPLFVERTKHVLLDGESKLMEKVCYVHHNPIHHSFSTNYRDWDFSSFSDYLTEGTLDSDKEHFLEYIGDGDIILGRNIFEKMHIEFKNIQNERDL